MDAPAGVTQEKCHTGFLHLPSTVLALILSARRIQPSLSLVDSEVDFCVPTNQLIVLYFLGIIFFLSFYLFFFVFFVRKNPSSCDCTEIRTHVPTQKGSRSRTEPPGRPASYSQYSHLNLLTCLLSGLDVIHYRESAGTGLAASKVVPVTGASFSGITMDHFSCAALFPRPPCLKKNQRTCAIQKVSEVRRVQTRRSAK